ncbi:MAG: hypothetical protein GX346_03320 [Clostridiales bacterium]|nr:hypothetical protein [Clostridiales bacterium]
MKIKPPSQNQPIQKAKAIKQADNSISRRTPHAQDFQQQMIQVKKPQQQKPQAISTVEKNQRDSQGLQVMMKVENQKVADSQQILKPQQALESTADIQMMKANKELVKDSEDSQNFSQD